MPDTTEASCPKCERGTAVAQKVIAGHGVNQVTYRCTSCGHEWTVTKPHQSLLSP